MGRVLNACGGDARGGRAAVGGSDPDGGMAGLIVHREGEKLAIVRDGVVFHGVAGEELVDFTGGEILNGKFGTGGLAVVEEEVKSFAIEGERRWDPLESTCRHASLSIL